MKKAAILGLLIIGLIFQNCKNNKAQKDVLINDETESVVIQDLDTTKVMENPETDIEVSTTGTSDEITEPLVEEPKNTSKEIVNTTNETSTIEEEIVVEKVSEVTETEKEIVEEIEEEEITAETPVIQKEIAEEIDPEPVIIENPKTVTEDNWKVPAKYQQLKSPISRTTDMAIGKSLYSKHCKSCHGSDGYGDGPKAAEMEGDLGDFSSEDFQNQSDGALFYKTSFGKDDMPEYTKKIPDDEDRWLIVNFLRTLAE